MLKNFSWPAVSQSCSSTRLPRISIVWILKSMPIVDFNDSLNVLSDRWRENRSSSPGPTIPYLQNETSTTFCQRNYRRWGEVWRYDRLLDATCSSVVIFQSKWWIWIASHRTSATSSSESSVCREMTEQERVWKRWEQMVRFFFLYSIHFKRERERERVQSTDDTRSSDSWLM